MATLAGAARPALGREHRFFFIMACAMAAVLVAGFSLSIAMRRSNFGEPVLIHVHAVTFFGWVVLYLLQTGLVSSGSVHLHKRLGWLSLAWVPAMVVLGTAITIFVERSHGAPFFFDQNEFLFGNPIGILCFAGVVGVAVYNRRRTAWHSRLMLCAMASITGPGFGRLLPLPFLIPWSWWLASVVFPSIFIIIGMIADKRRIGRVHPAYLYGLGALVGSQLVADAIAYSPVGYAATRAVIAGTPGAERPMRGYLPPGL